MTSTGRARDHAGHSHHHHHHDNTYLTSSNKNDAGVKITRIGLYVNLAMAVGKGIGGYVFHSQALIADAFHSLTDLVSDFMTLATISWSLKPPTERFPYGYGKVESLGALGVSGILLFGGLGMALNSLDVLYVQFLLDHAHEHAGHGGHGGHSHGLFGFLGHSHSHSVDIPNLNAAWLAAGSIVVKEWLYRATMKIARERKSSVLASNAVHHRIDSLTSIVALVSIAGAHVISNASWLDPVGGLIIAGMVIRAGWQNTMTALLELGDVSIDQDVKQSVRRTVKKALIGDAAKGLVGVRYGEDVEIQDIQGTKSGQNYLIDIDLAVPEALSVADTSLIERAVRERIGAKVRGARRVRIKFSSLDSEQSLGSDFIPADVSPRSSPEPEEDHDHDHHHADHAQSNGHAHSHTKKTS